MNMRLPTLLIWCAALLLASAAQAQVVRPSQSVYVLLRGGAALYYGDFDGNSDDNDDGAVLQPLDPLSEPGFFVGGEIGYQFNPNLSLGLSYDYNYDERLSATDGNDTALTVGGTTIQNGNDAHQVALRFRYLPFDGAKLSPYVDLGGALILGQGEEFERNNTGTDDVLGYGPLLGLGVDLALTPQFSLFLGAQSTLVFPDVALDGGDPGAFGLAATTPTSTSSLSWAVASSTPSARRTSRLRSRASSARASSPRVRPAPSWS